MKKDGVTNAILSMTVLSIVAIGVISFFVYEKRWIGLVFIVLGLLNLAVLRLFGRSVASVWPDIVFGIIDNGLMVIGALIGADFAGVIGAIVGSSAANAITDGYAGIFEGWVAEYLRKRHIEEKRTAVSTALGKMAGCFFGAGVALVVVWTILAL